MFTGVAGDRARAQLAGSRFADVRWVAETGSTNADAARPGPRRRARGDRARGRPPDRRPGPPRVAWEAPPGVVAARVGPAATARRGRLERHDGGRRGRRRGARGDGRRAPRAQVAERPRVAGRRLGAGPQAGRDPGRGRVAARGRRRLGSAAAGPGERAVVVVGIGLNVDWPDDLPAHLADVAIALNHVAGRDGRPRGPARRLARSGSTSTTAALRSDGPTPCSPSGERGRPPSAAGAGRARRRRDRRDGRRRDRRGPPRRRHRRRRRARSSRSATSSMSDRPAALRPPPPSRLSPGPCRSLGVERPGLEGGEGLGHRRS